MRKLTDHIVEGDLPQNQLKIEVTDEPGAGGANHLYRIYPIPIINNPLLKQLAEEQEKTEEDSSFILFQNGPIQEAGVNGITNEALLAIVIDRLRSFQAGPFACDDNAEALAHCEIALDFLKECTTQRLVRGVEGKMQR